MNYMKWMNQVRLGVSSSLATFSLLWCMGCSKPGVTPLQSNDSTLTFREVVENPHNALRFNKTELAGRLIFTGYCQVCHGPDGDGTGFNAFNLQNSFGVQPANFTDSAMMAALPEETMIMAISRGGKAVGKSQYMPPWGGTLSSGEVENVVAYIKALSKTKGVEELPKQE